MENSEELVHDLRLSTVVPGRVTGDGKLHELKGVDLAMKLHYLRALYFFTNNNNNNFATFMSISDFKNVYLFDWLETYFMTCGRMRPPAKEGAPPVIKLNDAGIRIVEAHSSKSVDQWLAMPNFTSLNHRLTYNHVLGPDLGFTPLVFIQVTWFKCGGVSVGLSWAHILGDAFAATTFMNSLGQYLEGRLQPKILSIPADATSVTAKPDNLQDPLCIKRVNPVEDGSWGTPTNDIKMETHSFWVSQEQLGKLKSSKKYGCFEVITGVIWKSIAKIRKEKEPRMVTICRPKSEPIGLEREHVFPYNGQLIGRVVSKSSKVSDGDLWDDLVSQIAGNVVDETEKLENYFQKTSGEDNVIVYGANLTFVDMVDADVYGFQLKGQSPVYASYSVDGIGDQGVVVVLPGPTTHDKMLILMTLPHSEIEPLEAELMEQWSIIA